VTAFDPDFRTKLRELIIWRRDVRRFRADALPTGTVDRLPALASLAPSRLSQPWRFVIVDDVARRGSSASGILPLQ
jgi:5,6-dimethylbenzimidazole synthase